MEFIETLNLYPSRDGVSLAVAKLTCSVESPYINCQLCSPLGCGLSLSQQGEETRNINSSTVEPLKKVKCEKAFPTMANIGDCVETTRYGWVVKTATFAPRRRPWPRKSDVSPLLWRVTLHSFSAQGWKKGVELWMWSTIAENRSVCCW